MTKKEFLRRFRVSFVNYAGIYNELYDKTVRNALIKSPVSGKFEGVRIGTFHDYSELNSMLLVEFKGIVEKSRDTLRLKSRRLYSSPGCANVNETKFLRCDNFKQYASREYKYYIFNGDVPCINIRMKDIPVAQVFYPNIINITIENLFNTEENYYFDLKVFADILRQGLKYLSLSKKDFYAKVFLENEEQLNKVILKSVRTQMDESHKKIFSAQERIGTLTEEIAKNQEIILVETKKLESYEEISHSVYSKLMSEIQYIKNIKGVKSVDGFSSLSNGLIKVYTDDIYVKNQRSRYWLGSYVIEIDIVKGEVWFKNTSEEFLRSSAWGDKCHHPHCDQKGHPCLGNIQTQVAELLRSFDISFLVNLCLSYLSSVNINDAAGKHIVNWPLVDNEGREISNKNEQGLIKCTTCGIYMPDEENESWVQCEVCKEWVCEKHQEKVETKDGTVTVCSKCLRAYHVCHVCGKYSFSSLMTMCDVCGEVVCNDCMQRIDGPVYNAEGNIYNHICAHHNIIECSGCGINIVEGNSCPQCSGNVHIEKCELCGREGEPAHRVTGQNICDRCIELAEICCFCGKYDFRDNLTLDYNLNIYKHEICPITEHSENNNETGGE